MSFLILLAFAADALAVPMDLSALDDAIERCDRETVLPVFAAEARRRSGFASAAYAEQAGISAERVTLADKRRALRENAADAASSKVHPSKAAESDQALALAQLALEDRQRALDDRRRLETMRQEAVEVKRQYFLAHCPPPKKKTE